MFQPGLASFTFVCLFVKFTIASSGHLALCPRGGQPTRRGALRGALTAALLWRLHCSAAPSGYRQCHLTFIQGSRETLGEIIF